MIVLTWEARCKAGDEVRILRCPTCRRLTADWPRACRALGCFDGHDSADYEVVAVLHGPAATAVWSLFQVSQLATDEEYQGEILAAGAASLLDAISQRVDVALEDIQDQPDPNSSLVEGGGDRG